MKHKVHNKETSNNLELCIYDKGKETRERALRGKANKDEELFYKDVIRTEVKVKNGKLNSNKSQDKNNNKGKIRTKDLENYYNYEALGLYYTKTIIKIFGTEPFYRLDIALDKIQKNSQLKDSMKFKLCTLLKLINEKGYTRAKQVWIDTFSISTFNSHIKKIKTLGINILTFNTELNGEVIAYEKIPNFTQLDNSEMEFIQSYQTKF